MNPIVILVLQSLIKYGPDLAREIVALFSVENPTQEQWNKIFDLADKSYEDYVAPTTSIGGNIPTLSKLNK